MQVLHDWVAQYRKWRDEEEKLNTQFFLTLNSIFLRFKPQQPTPEETVITARIEALLTGPEQWAFAYEAEQLLLNLYDDTAIKVELDRRLVEAEQNLSEKVATTYKDESSTATPTQQRALVARLVNDLQWRYSINETKRKYTRIVTRKTCTVFILTIILFGIVFWFWQQPENIERPELAVFLAGAAGFWGASFSMLIGLRKRLEASSFDQLKAMRRWGYGISRAIIGLGAASILYFMIYCGLLSGSVFPTLNPHASEQRVNETEEAVKVLAWSWIAELSNDTNEKDDQVSQAVESLAQRTKVVMQTKALDPKGIFAHESKNLAAVLCQKEPNADSPCKKPDETNPEINRFTEELAKDLVTLVEKESALGLTSIALLIVWSFLAGFSETFVPNLLSKTEEKVSTQ